MKIYVTQQCVISYKLGKWEIWGNFYIAKDIEESSVYVTILVGVGTICVIGIVVIIVL